MNRFVIRILKFLKNKIKREKNIRLLDAPIEENIQELTRKNNKNKFLEDLKVNLKGRKKVETITCEGDGLGIQNKLKY